jgi:hypothetical protein
MIITFIKVIHRSLLFTAFLILCFLSKPLFSQVNNDYGFQRSLYYPVLSRSGDTLRYPWAGGLNSCQFNATDLNFDGVKDMVIFDRIGERILTFINLGTPDTESYLYDPQYEKFFPSVTGWLIMRDFNLDGKEDVFSYGYGGIKVFKNISDPVNGLAFELVTNQLLSYMYNGYVNIYVSDVDYPVIDDLDGDGDLDILAFWILGTYIHYHKNLCMEDYGNCDSLKYRLKSTCWGYIKEGDTSNHITLNAFCPIFKGPTAEDGPPTEVFNKEPGDIEHVGSTLLTLDLNGDSLRDLILGDVDYPTVIGLVNGGNKDTARIISQESNFPSYDTPVNIYSFPVITNIDVNNDGKRDLLVSPFDPSTLITESDHSVWMYRNEGEDNNPVYHIQTQEFLQGDMIDVGTTALPVFCDVNQDGLQDLVIGNYGFYDSSYYTNGYLHSVFRSRLTVWYNAGTSDTPAFELGDTNFAGVAALNLTYAFPAFGDLDQDNDLDMILGNSDGTVYYYQNTAGAGHPLSFSNPVAGYQGIDAGNCSAPQLWDLDEDGLLDLVIGNKKGLLSYYHNEGSPQSPVFAWVTDSLGKVDVREAAVSWDGYSVPCFFKNNADSTRLFVGSLKGGVQYYKNIEGHLNDTFSLVGENYLYLRYGTNSGIAVNDLDHDGYIDMVMGNTCGGLAYFKGCEPGPIGVPEIEGLSGITCWLYPNPSRQYCMIDASVSEKFTGAKFSIHDVGGKCVSEGQISSFPAKIMNPPVSGIYYVNLTFFEGNKASLIPKPLKMIVIR